MPGLASDGLFRAKIDLPPGIAQMLKTDALNAVRAGLSQCDESIRLQRLLEQAACPCAFLKGVTLAALGYGDLGIRQAKDIDVIVPAADFAAACDVIERAGYRRVRPPPGLSGDFLPLWLEYGKDMEWRHDAKKIDLELHWRLTNIRFLSNEPPDFTALQVVNITASAGITTLPAPDLFVYLCVHGAAHGWCRLKWLADINALLGDASDERVEQHFDFANTRNAQRAVGQALMLCEQLFKRPLPPRLAKKLRASPVISALAKIGILSMTRGKAERESYDQAFGTTLINASHFLLATSWRSRLAHLAHMGINLDDALYVPLPRSLNFLYWLLRVPLWLMRRMRAVGASPNRARG